MGKSRPRPWLVRFPFDRLPSHIFSLLLGIPLALFLGAALQPVQAVSHADLRPVVPHGKMVSGVPLSRGEWHEEFSRLAQRSRGA